MGGLIKQIQKRHFQRVKSQLGGILFIRPFFPDWKLQKLIKFLWNVCNDDVKTFLIQGNLKNTIIANLPGVLELVNKLWLS